jgi:multicomponent K+:H+ antiporter subunit E
VRRLLPYPLLALMLLAMWLLLTQSVSPGQIVLGSLAALFATQAMAALRPRTSRVGPLRAVLKLAVIVIFDIVRSNFAVAAIVLFRRRERVASFVRMPLQLESRNGLAILALIITTTPGTVWVDYDRGRRSLLVHVFDLVDEEEWIALIKRRYEALLLEIFGR